jgi:hypothetical protein
MHQTRRSWGSLFHIVRASAVVLAVTLLVLLLAPESRDMMSGIWDTGLLHGATAYAALLFLGVSAWHWSRAALSARFGVKSRAGGAAPAAVNPVAFDLVPRLMFLAAVGVGLVLALRSQGGRWLALPLVLAGAAGFAILTYRLKLPRVIGGGERSLAATRTQRQEPAWLRRAPQSIRELLTYAPLGPHFAAALLGGAVLFFALGAAGSLVMIDHTRAYLPVFVGRLFPGPGAALLCLALAIAPLTALTFWSDGWTWACTPFGLALRARWFPILLIPALIVLKTPVWFALHRVRIVAPPGSAAVATLRPEDRPGLQRLLDRWAQACAAGADKSLPLRPVIVAVSGGASRAALWGARVLTMADELARARKTGVFAVSSVSGGSVGAAAYMAWLRGQAAPAPCAPLGEAAFRPDVMMAALKADALGPLLAGALFGDIPRALMSVVLLPIHKLDRSITGLARGGDRADALEVAFEENWRDATGNADPPLQNQPVGLDSAYLSLNQDAPGRGGSLPIWIANGTDQQNGERLLTVPFQAKPADLPFGPAGGMGADWPFEGAKDVLGVLHADMPMSTVIDNTCRFPLLSPVGELTPIPDAAGPTVEYPMQIIDGGYFENEGAMTAWELADWLRLHKADGHPVQPILVQATADAADAPGLDALDRLIPRCTGPFADNPVAGIGQARTDQFSAPLQGLLGIRGGHSGWVLRRVLDEYCAPGPQQAQRFFNFYLYRDYHHDRSVPLNWTLSDDMARFIWTDAIQEGRNPVEAAGLASALSASANAAGATPPP